MIRKYLNKIVFVLVVCAIGAIGFSSVAKATTIGRPTNNIGVVGHWTFDGKDMTPNVRDISGNGNHGNLFGQNSGTTTVAGKLSQALSFDGVDDYVDAGAPSTLDLQSANKFTLSAWIRPRIDPQATGVISEFYDGGSDQTVQYTIGFGVANTNYSDAHCGFFYGGSWKYVDHAAGSPGVTLNTWTLLTCTWDGTTLRLYKNGVQVNSATPGGSLPASFTKVYVGRRHDSFAGPYFPGSIDDARIYNRSLSATEIKSLYNSSALKFSSSQSAVGIDAGLVGHWTFDGKDMKPSVVDTSGNGKSGVIYKGYFGPQPATSTIPGKLGQALVWSTDEYIDLGTMNEINNVAQLTFSFWIKKPFNGATESLFFRQGTGDPGGHRIGINIDSNGMFVMYVGNGGDKAGFGSLVIADNKWHLATFVYDGTQTGDSNRLKFYIDNVLDPGMSYWSPIPATTPDLSADNITFRLGCDMYSSQYYNGALDDFRIYTRALSTSDIAQLYLMGAGTKTAASQARVGGALDSGLVGYWSFNGADVTDKIYDRSGSGFNGYIAALSGVRATSSLIVQGKVGQGLEFDQTDYVHVTNFSWANGPVTVSFWNYVPSAPASGASAFGGESTCTNRFQAHVPYSGGTLYWDYGYCAGDGRIQTSYASYYGKWTYVTLVSGGPSSAWKAIYINGDLVVSDTNPISNGPSVSSNFDIGSFYDTGGTRTNHYGKIDEFRLYNRVLSASEIKQLYNMGR